MIPNNNVDIEWNKFSILSHLQSKMHYCLRLIFYDFIIYTTGEKVDREFTKA